MGIGAAGGVDLHTHTTASDGDHSPEELLRSAASLGLAAIGVTDHDTIDGLEAAAVAADRYGIELIPGVELSAQIDRGQCHLLGYMIDPHCSRLLSALEEIRDHRSRRNSAMVERLQNEHGFRISLEEVELVAGGDVVARPHFARALLNRGYVATMQEAFDKYLARGGTAYVERRRLSPKESIDLIHAAGGVAVLAHPNNLKLNELETEQLIVRLLKCGLDGVEARYGRHSASDCARYLTLAKRLDIVTSGGSDFHGPSVKPNVLLGHVEGANPAPYEVVEGLRARQTAMHNR